VFQKSFIIVPNDGKRFDFTKVDMAVSV